MLGSHVTSTELREPGIVRRRTGVCRISIRFHADARRCGPGALRSPRDRRLTHDLGAGFGRCRRGELELGLDLTQRRLGLSDSADPDHPTPTLPRSTSMFFSPSDRKTVGANPADSMSMFPRASEVPAVPGMFCRFKV